MPAVHRECLAHVCCHVSALADVEVVEGVGRAFHDLVIDFGAGLRQKAVHLRNGDGGQLRGGQVAVEGGFRGEQRQDAGLHIQLADQEVGVADLAFGLLVHDDRIQFFAERTGLLHVAVLAVVVQRFDLPEEFVVGSGVRRSEDFHVPVFVEVRHG